MRMLKNWLTARMPAQSPEITTDGVVVEVVRKHIKNFYLRVDRTQGRVRMSAPRSASDDEVRLVVARRIDWIKRQQARIATAPPSDRPRYASGETHFFLGRPHRLEVVERDGRSGSVVRTESTLELHIRRRSRVDERQRTLHEWYRNEIKALIPPLIEKWQPLIGVTVAEWGVKRMRTRWGTCNIRARRIWLNLELAKHPAECLEYVVVHEMVHLLERRHNAHFKALMDSFLSDWRRRQRTLGGRLAGHYKQSDGHDDQIDPCD
ncbi:MAG: SprT family zinc-dependent metalloprotease [Pirellulales bacterium]